MRVHLPIKNILLVSAYLPSVHISTPTLTPNTLRQGWEAEDVSASAVLGVSQSRGLGVRNTWDGPGVPQAWVWEMCLALTNKALVMRSKWELSLTRVVCVFPRPAAIWASLRFLGKHAPCDWFCQPQGQSHWPSSKHAVWLWPSLAQGLDEVLTPITRKEADLGNQHF